MILLLGLLLAQADTIRLGAGVHHGPLVLARPTVVLGAPGAILRGNGQGSVLRIEAAGSTVRDLRIERGGRNPDGDDAGVLVLADSVTLERLVIRDVLFGVYLREVKDVVLRELDIDGPPGLAESAMGDGIHFFHSRRVVAADNRISHMRDGMYFAYSDSVTVSGNEVTAVRFGLHYMFSHQNHFSDNRFHDNAAGAVLMNSNGLVVRQNVFSWNRGSRSYGLVLQTTTGAVIENNVMAGNGVGIFLDNAIAARITGNRIAGNWLALQLFPNSERTVLTGNSIEGNTFDAAGGWSEGAYELCAGGQGNYWSAARRDGFDLDKDGRLDQPYPASSPLGELARDREPLRLFLDSPAARVIAWAERTFPVFQVDQITDPCPLSTAPPMVARVSTVKEFTGPKSNRMAQGGLASGAMVAGILLIRTVAARRRP